MLHVVMLLLESTLHTGPIYMSVLAMLQLLKTKCLHSILRERSATEIEQYDIG